MNNLKTAEAKINSFAFAIACCICAFFAFIQYKIGHPNNLLYLKTISLSALLLFLPDIIRSKLRAENILNTAFITTLLLILLSFTGALLENNSNEIGGYIIITLALLSIALYGIVSFKDHSLAIISYGLLFGIIFALFIYGIDFLSPFLIEKSVDLGKMSPDSLFHISISNIFSTYNVATTGLDGTPYFSYHYLSHALMAKLSDLLNIKIIDFFNLAYPCIFIPLYFKFFCLCILDIRKHFKISGNIDLLFFSLLLLVHYRMFYNEDTGFAALTPFNSEPYLIGLLFTFQLISFIFSSLSSTNGQLRLTHYFIFAFYLLLITSTKISLGFVLIASLSYLFVRLKWYKQKQLILISLMYLTIFAVCYKFLTFSVNEKFLITRPFGVLKWTSVYFIPFYLMLVLLIAFELGLSIKTLSLRSLKVTTEFLHIELLVVIAIAGLLPGMIWSMFGNRHYFSDPQYWMSSLFLLGFFPSYSTRIKKLIPVNAIKISKVILVIIAINITVRYIDKSFIFYKGIKSDISQITNKKRPVRDESFITLLEDISKYNKAEKKQSCVVLSNIESLCDSTVHKNRFALPFLVPSVAGICLINGIYEDFDRKDFSYPLYANNIIKVPDSLMLVEKAKKMGFKDLLYIKIKQSHEKCELTKIKI